MAAPALAAAFAPDATSTEIRDAILATVDVLPQLNGVVGTRGRLNVANLLQSLNPMLTPGPNFNTGATDIEQPFSLRWETDPRSTATLLEIRRASDGQQVLFRSLPTNASNQMEFVLDGLDSGTDYTLGLVSIDQATNLDSVGSLTAFTTAKIAPLRILAPNFVNGQPVESPLDVTWETDPRSTSTFLEIRRVSDDRQIVSRDIPTNFANRGEFVFDGLAPGTEYTLRLVSVDQATNLDSVFSVTAFKTAPAAPLPAIRPNFANGATITQPFNVAWQTDPRATSTFFEIRRVSHDRQMIFRDLPTNATNRGQFPINGLEPGNYVLNLSSVDRATGLDSVGSATSFSIPTPPTPTPGATNITNLKNGAVDVRLQKNFTWNPASHASDYILRIYRGSAVIRTYATAGTELTIPDTGRLDGRRAFSASIQARNASGVGPESPRVSFTTRANNRISSTRITNLENGATDVRRQKQFTWTPVPGASRYVLYIKQGGNVVRRIEVSGASHRLTDAQRLDGTTNLTVQMASIFPDGVNGGESIQSDPISFQTRA